jgi:hypothetical protein
MPGNSPAIAAPLFVQALLPVRNKRCVNTPLTPPVFKFDLPEYLVYPIALNFEYGAQHHTQLTRRETFVVHPLQVTNRHIADQRIFILAKRHAGVYNIN